YDMPNVGTGGYAVPNYIMKEGYGQGTFTTKWLPPGTYTTPTIPHYLNRRPQVVKERKLPGGGRSITIQRHASAPTGAPATAALSGIPDSPLVPIAAAAGIAYLLLKKKRK